MNRLDITTSTAYMRHDFVPFKEASLSIASSPVLYGLSVYTVFSVNWNVKERKLYIFRLKDHFKRLLNSAKIMDFHAFVEDWDYQEFEDTILELLKRNNVQEDALVRVAVFIDEISPGTRIHSLANSLSAYVYPMGELLPLTGINVCVSSWQRTPDNAIPSRAKVYGSYINASLMKNEALQNGYDEAISLDMHGHVAESTVANVFMVRDGRLITPDSSTDILEGITRDSILKIAESLAIPYEQRSIDRSELYIADEVFVCGSSARIVPVLSIDKREVARGEIGPVTTKLMKAYDAIQHGAVKDFAEWRLTS